MKELSEFEREAIKKIIEIDNKEDFVHVNSFINGIVKIKSEFMFVGHEYDYELKEGETHYYKIQIKGNRSEIVGDSLYMNKKIIELYYLLKYLIESGLLLQIEGWDFMGLVINKRDFLENEVIEIKELYITDTLKKLLELCSYHFQPTEELKDLVNHNFISKEERNNLKIRKIAIASFILSFISIIFSVLFNIFEIKNENTKSKNEIKIDTSSINYYFKKNNESEKKLQEIVDTLKLD